MGFGSASREEKLKMMKTKRTKKLTKKLNKLGKKKVLSRGIIDQFNAIKSEKSKDSRKRATNIEDDWMADRDTHFNEEEEDVLPLDMLDADIDWANSAFAGMKRRHDEKDDTEQSDDDLETKKRKFKGQLDENLEEMLPIKLQDGRLLRPTREKAVEEGEEAADDLEETKEEWKPEDFSALSASELLAKRKQLLQEAKERISTVSGLLLANPQENVMKLRDLYQLCQGFQVHPLVRENVQKIAMVSTVQVLIDVIPGYAIRPLTDAERQQKQKKETKKLVAFEESLLRYYLKFLQLCEKLAGKFMGKNRQVDEETFTYKVGMISVKALARLATSCAHFNYTTNIVSTLVRLSLCKNQVILKEICDALSALFKEDVHLQMSLFGARSIATLVTKRKGRVPPQLLETFLHLNIREVKNNDKKSGKGKIFAKRALIKKEKANKSARKYKKQLDKLEADLKELDAQESISAKLKNATEAMKYVFQTYFSILKRMPNLELLSPCLEGLSKFAHLLGVEFFDDLILTMEQLVDREHLRIVDQLHCVHTVFVMLTGEGQLLNVDPSKFYRSVYRIINAVPFETKYVWDRGSISEMSQVYSLVINMFIPENRTKQLTMLCRALDAMINERRKQVPLQRVAAFTKRLLCVASVMDDRSAACILALVRSFFIAHPKILSMTEADDEGGSGTYGGIFRADINDPDVCNALGAGVRQELRLLAKRRFKPVHQIANNILHGVPSTGQMRLNPEFNVKPAILLDYSDNTEQSDHEKVDMKYLDQIRDYCKKRQFELTAENAQFHILHWLEAK